MRAHLSLLVLASLAVAGCDAVLVTFPADRGGRPDLEALGFDLGDVPDGVLGSEGTLGGLDSLGLSTNDVRPNGGAGFEAPLPPVDGGDSECGPVVSQTGWCVTLRDHPGPGSGVTFIGLDDGATCAPVDAPVAASVLNVGSLGLQGTTLAWCDAGGGVHQVDLSTGSVVTTAIPSLGCDSLTSAAGGFVILPDGSGSDLKWFPRLSEMLNGGSGTTWPVRPSADRIAADTQVIYTAQQQTDVVSRWLTDGTVLEPLVLDDFGLIYGLDSAPGNRMVLLDGQRDLVVYDRITGAQTDVFSLSSNFAGLACFPEP